MPVCVRIVLVCVQDYWYFLLVSRPPTPVRTSPLTTDQKTFFLSQPPALKKRKADQSFSPPSSISSSTAVNQLQQLFVSWVDSRPVGLTCKAPDEVLEKFRKLLNRLVQFVYRVSPDALPKETIKCSVEPLRSGGYTPSCRIPPGRGVVNQFCMDRI